MKFLTATVVIGPLMLAGVLPAAAQSINSDTPIQLAAGSDSTVDRETYTQKAQAEIQEWQKKLHDFGADTEAKGQEAGNAARNDLNEAWTRTQAASRQLQTVGDEGWESAKTAYEKASHDMAEAWQKVHPSDK